MNPNFVKERVRKDIVKTKAPGLGYLLKLHDQYVDVIQNKGGIHVSWVDFDNEYNTYRRTFDKTERKKADKFAIDKIISLELAVCDKRAKAAVAAAVDAGIL